VIPYRESKKIQASRSSLHSTSSPLQSPHAVSSVQQPLSPDTKSPQASVPHNPPSPSLPVAASSYEEPVIRNVNEHSPIPKPVEPSASIGSNFVGIYSEVDADAIISIVGVTQNNEYSEAKYGRDDPNVAPPLPASVNNYESLSRGEKVEKAGHAPVAYKIRPSNSDVEVGPSNSDVIATSNTKATFANMKDSACKDKKPPVPKLKPPLPATKPTQFEQIPPKPKRTYATNMQQPTSPNLSTPTNPLDSSVNSRLSKPMPLPRVKSEEHIADDASSKVVKAAVESSLSQDKPNSKETNKVNQIPALYSYVDIDIPDSPKQVVSTEKFPSVTVNITEPSKIVSTTQQAEPTTAVVKKVAPQPPNVANKPKRRTPPPPPPTGPKPKLKPVLQPPVNQPDSNHTKSPSPNVAPNKPKHLPGHPNTLPAPTPAKPIPPKKWFHLVTKKPGSRSPPIDKKAPSPIVARDAGNTPPTSKRRDSKKRKFFRIHKQQPENGSATSPPIDKKPSPPIDKKPTQAAVEQDRPDSPPTFGYAAVGPNKTNEKKINAVSIIKSP